MPLPLPLNVAWRLVASDSAYGQPPDALSRKASLPTHTSQYFVPAVTCTPFDRLTVFHAAAFEEVTVVLSSSAPGAPDASEYKPRLTFAVPEFTYAATDVAVPNAEAVHCHA
jgi:hypothetical protein